MLGTRLQVLLRRKYGFWVTPGLIDPEHPRTIPFLQSFEVYMSFCVTSVVPNQVVFCETFLQIFFICFPQYVEMFLSDLITHPIKYHIYCSDFPPFCLQWYAPIKYPFPLELVFVSGLFLLGRFLWRLLLVVFKQSYKFNFCRIIHDVAHDAAFHVYGPLIFGAFIGLGFWFLVAGLEKSILLICYMPQM